MIIKDQIILDQVDLRQDVIDALGAPGELVDYSLWKNIENDHEHYQQITFLKNQFSLLKEGVDSIDQDYKDQIKRTQSIDILKSSDTHLSSIIDWSNSSVVIDPYDGSIRPVARALNEVPGEWAASGSILFEDESNLIASSLASIVFSSEHANYIGFYITNVDYVIINGVRRDVKRGVSLDFSGTVRIDIPSEFLNRNIALENIYFARIAYETHAVIQTTALSEVYRVPNKILVPEQSRVFWEFSTDGSTWHEDSTIIKDSDDRPFVHQRWKKIGTSVVLSTTLGGDPVSSIISLTSGVQTPVDGEYPVAHWILPETLRLYRDIDTWLITDTLHGGYGLVAENDPLNTPFQELGGFFFTAERGRAYVSMSTADLDTQADPEWERLKRLLAHHEEDISKLRIRLMGIRSIVDPPDTPLFWEGQLTRLNDWLTTINLSNQSVTTSNSGNNSRNNRGYTSVKHPDRVQVLNEDPFDSNSVIHLDTEAWLSSIPQYGQTLTRYSGNWETLTDAQKIHWITVQRDKVNFIVINKNEGQAQAEEELANTTLEDRIELRENAVEDILVAMSIFENNSRKEIKLPLTKTLFDSMLLGNETDNLENDINSLNAAINNAGGTIKERDELRDFIVYKNGQELLDRHRFKDFIEAEKELVQHYAGFGAISIKDPTSSRFSESIGKVQTNFYSAKNTTISLAIASDLFKHTRDNAEVDIGPQNLVNIRHKNNSTVLIPSSSQFSDGILYDIFEVPLSEGRNYVWFLSNQVSTHTIADWLNIKIVEDGVFYPFTMERIGLISSPFPPSRALDYQTWLHYTEERRKFEVVGLKNYYNHIDSAWESKIYVDSPTGFPYGDRAMYLEYRYRDDTPSAIRATSASYYIRGSIKSDSNLATRINNFNIGHRF